MFLEKGVLKIWSKFTREHPCGSVISINFLRTTASERALVLTKMMPIPIPINVSNAFYQKRFVLFYFPHCLQLIRKNFYKKIINVFLVIGLFLLPELKRM